MKIASMSLAILFIIILNYSQLYSGDVNFKVMTYNAENFTGEFITYPYNIWASTYKVKHFRTVINEVDPDIIIMQEMRNQSGVSLMLDSLNIGTSVYLRSDSLYLRGSSNDGYANMIFYKESVVTLLSHTMIIPTDSSRFIDKFKLEVNGNEFYIFGCHLKSSPYETEQRLSEVTALRDNLNTLPENSDFLVCGDMNFYNNGDESYSTGTREVAYLKFIQSEENNNGRCEDPLGNDQWEENFIIHSQSTENLDDRFDFIFNSFDMNDNTGIDRVSDSYISYGNDGNHFEQDVYDSTGINPNTIVPEEIAYALWKASDHLPVVAEYISYDPNNDIEVNDISTSILLQNYPNPFNPTTTINYTLPTAQNIELEIYNTEGKRVALVDKGIKEAGEHKKVFDGTNLSSGIYYYSLKADKEILATRKMMLIK